MGLFDTIREIKKKKGQLDAALSGGDPNAVGQQTKAAPPKTKEDDAGDELFKQQKAAWEKRTGRKWIE